MPTRVEMLSSSFDVSLPSLKAFADDPVPVRAANSFQSFIDRCIDP